MSALHRLRNHLRVPLHRDSYALIAGAALTSVLGVVFWFTAARVTDPADLGIASSTLSVIAFLANVATLGLRNGLIRFLPIDRAPLRLVRRAYGSCTLAAATAAVVFLFGQPWWAPELGLVRSGPLPALAFVAATVAWLLFVLQDAVLTGTRLAPWVPVENGLFAVTKLGLLLALVGVGVDSTPTTVLVAWMLPAAAIVVPLNLLVRRRLRRRHLPTETGASTTAVRPLVRFAAADHLAGLLWLATTDVMPLVVLGVLGAGAGATYFVAFTVAYSLYLVTSNVGSAMVVELSLRPEREAETVRRSLTQAARLVVPAALAGIVAAPWLLSLFGEHYRTTGTTLVRLMLASAVPQVVVGIAVSRARARRRLSVVVAVYATTAIAVLGGAAAALSWVGLDAAGWAWLGVQLGLATVLAPSLVAAVDRRSDVLRWLGAARTELLSRPRRADRALAERALAATGLVTRGPLTVRRSDSDVLVAFASTDRGDVVVKHATTDAAAPRLRAHARALRPGAAPGPEVLDAAVPELLAVGRVDGRATTVEARAIGTPADHLGGAARARAIHEIEELADRLHTGTARTDRVDDELLDELVDRHLDRIRELAERHGRADALAALRAELHAALAGRDLRLATVHGDLWAGNAIVAEDPSGTCRVSLVDWEDISSTGLPAVDQAHLWLSEQPEEIGATVARHLRPTDSEHPAVDGRPALPDRARDPVVPDRCVLLLAWAAHVSGVVGRTTAVPPSRRWVRRNVLDVLDAAAPDHEVPARPDRRADAVAVAGLAVAVAAWVVGLSDSRQQDMGALGFVSLLDPAMVTALALVTLGFLDALRRRAPGWLLGAHLVVFVVLVHGTPAAFYETLRYAWAWKHVGIVEFIQRSGRVDTTLEAGRIYQSWPGFFAGSALLTELLGARTSIRLATWAPVAFNLANLLAARFLFRSLVGSARTVWLALWLFATANWVGQDYFSPQAMSFVLHLTAMGLVLRGFRRTAVPVPVLGERMTARAVAPVFLLLTATIASSHQVTPFMLIVTLAGLVVVRVVRTIWLVAAAVAVVGTWAGTIGRSVVTSEAGSLASGFLRPVENAEETLAKASNRLPEQVLVSLAGRGVIVLLTVLAGVGALRLLRARRLDRSLLVLAAAPAVLPLTTSFGGEAVFRVFLFSLPGLALLAAAALVPPEPGGAPAGPSLRVHPVRAGAVVLASFALVAGFLLAYTGKDQQYSFTHKELAASQWVTSQGRDPTLVVEVSRNYPARFERYEQFTHVTIGREPTSSWRSVLADPAERLAGWLADPRFRDAYVVLTRSQAIDVDANGPLPVGAVAGIDRALRASDRFRVTFENEDAVVFELAPERADDVAGGAQ